MNDHERIARALAVAGTESEAFSVEAVEVSSATGRDGRRAACLGIAGRWVALTSPKEVDTVLGLLAKARSMAFPDGPPFSPPTIAVVGRTGVTEIDL